MVDRYKVNVSEGFYGTQNVTITKDPTPTFVLATFAIASGAFFFPILLPPLVLYASRSLRRYLLSTLLVIPVLFLFTVTAKYFNWMHLPRKLHLSSDGFYLYLLMGLNVMLIAIIALAVWGVWKLAIRLWDFFSSL